MKLRRQSDCIELRPCDRESAATSDFEIHDPETFTADDWDAYECEINQRAVSIFVNLSAIRRAPSPDKPWLLRISARTLTAGSGAPYAERSLSELQYMAIGDLADGDSCEFVGSVSSCTSRDLYFYSTSIKRFGRVVEKARSAFPQCSIDCRSEPDRQWRQYREVLYPGAIEMQRIRNRRVLRQLELGRDDHSVIRPVDHGLYFRTVLDSTGFIGAAGKIGFRPRFPPKLRTSSRLARPFFVSVVRSDPVTSDHICDVALELLMLAIRFDGEYDGWGCDVCSPKSECVLTGRVVSNTSPRRPVRDTPKDEESGSGEPH
jgi:hypothetical protein